MDNSHYTALIPKDAFCVRYMEGGIKKKNSYILYITKGREAADLIAHFVAKKDTPACVVGLLGKKVTSGVISLAKDARGTQLYFHKKSTLARVVDALKEYTPLRELTFTT